uniref:Small hydrophobic protein n=1 Tax=Mumps virus genotype G TaxID=1384672 RepID=A0A482LQY4_MUMPV|nr:small hydrophobic protein variant [Mumps virus genotype G]QBQ34357.1 small hydrophobic protein readthrough variant [Mumps virus genotype G]QBQ34358.1 small hydrophobic protein readthrough variant [Mumps virus genotype G]QBQ34359.1 small hydrophobic protein readthrough variant [Mumps virus genotype G]QBQ34360.1 small hydrophobic protein readthrough variant [Mumps virus genotype G]
MPAIQPPLYLTFPLPTPPHPITTLHVWTTLTVTYKTAVRHAAPHQRSLPHWSLDHPLQEDPQLGQVPIHHARTICI